MLTVSLRKVIENKKHGFWSVKAALLQGNNYAFTDQKPCFHIVISMLLLRNAEERRQRNLFGLFFRVCKFAVPIF